MMDKPIRSNEWKVYTVTGRIDKDAAYLVFGGLYHRKGIFYFDDFKVWTLSSNVGVSENNSAVFMSVYPNPANTFATLNYSISAGEKYELKVLNTIGQTIFSSPLNPSMKSTSINLKDLDQGLYFCQITTANSILATKRMSIIK